MALYNRSLTLLCICALYPTPTCLSKSLKAAWPRLTRRSISTSAWGLRAAWRLTTWTLKHSGRAATSGSPGAAVCRLLRHQGTRNVLSTASTRPSGDIAHTGQHQANHFDAAGVMIRTGRRRFGTSGIHIFLYFPAGLRFRCHRQLLQLRQARTRSVGEGPPLHGGQAALPTAATPNVQAELQA